MKSKFIFFFLPFLLMNACSVDYDFNDLKLTEPECIIVNGILTPSKPIQVQLYRLQNTDNRYLCVGLKGAKVTLREEQDVIYDAICPDSVLTTNYFPKANATYTLEVSYDNLKTVSASTKVPQAITCEAYFNYGEYDWDQREYLITLNSFELPPTERISLWVISYKVFQNDAIIQYNELYTNHPLVDKANSTAGMGVINETVGSIYHNGFLRVKNKNLPFLDELIFTPSFTHVHGHEYPEVELPQVKIKVTLITASPEYDQFAKSLYEQKSMIVYDEDISSIFFQPKTVYSNIEHGLGIFAGINERSDLFDYPKKND